MLVVYGQWDPWTGGEFALGGAVDSASCTSSPKARTTPISSTSATSDEAAAFAKLAAWTGVTPTPPPATHAAIPRVHVPRLHGRHHSP